MEISDIVNGIAIAVDKVFPDIDIYTEKIEQDFKKPAVLIHMVNFGYEKQLTDRFKVTPMFNIQYFPLVGAVECYDANLKIQNGLNVIELVNSVTMLSRGTSSVVVSGENGEVVGQNMARFDFFLKTEKELEPMLTLTHYLNDERVNVID